MRNCCRGRSSPASRGRGAWPQDLHRPPFADNGSKVTSELVRAFMKQLASMNGSASSLALFSVRLSGVMIDIPATHRGAALGRSGGQSDRATHIWDT